MNHSWKLRRWVFLLLPILLAGCATEGFPPSQLSPSYQAALPSLSGSYHVVQPGETLWRIARSYGLEVATLASANRIRNGQSVAAGQRLFLPLPAESARFLWPIRGRVGQSHAGGVDITAQAGSLVRASRSGRVAVATHRLSGWGKAVIVDHPDGFVTVYAGLQQVLVSPGALIRQGMPLGTAGWQALHFEIREGSKPRNSLSLLPAGS